MSSNVKRSATFSDNPEPRPVKVPKTRPESTIRTANKFQNIDDAMQWVKYELEDVEIEVRGAEVAVEMAEARLEESLERAKDEVKRAKATLQNEQEKLEDLKELLDKVKQFAKKGGFDHVSVEGEAEEEKEEKSLARVEAHLKSRGF